MARWFKTVASSFLFAVSASAQQTAENGPPLTDRERILLERIDKLEQRVAALENQRSSEKAAITSRRDPGPSSTPSSGSVETSSLSAPASVPNQAGSNNAPANSTPPLTFANGTTLNFLLDGYYSYNFNDPIGRTNLLRAYDVSSNAFSLNQAVLLIENAADPSEGRRFGLRLDFQYGQATETLQGNPANEPRPGIYRNVFQAYGTYVVPVGKGLTLDFGKFASSLGVEGNYTKDQMNYSRSYWFNFLPFYHMGIRANYKFTDKFGLNYWIVNGTQQTEAFNGFKDQFFGLAFQPSKTLTWNANYYLGQEHPDVIFYPNGGAPPGLPALQGVPFQPIPNAPNGKLHIFDTYLTWQATSKLTFAAEADYVVERLWSYSAPSHTDGGAAYLKYQISPKVFLAGRAEYLSDRGGLFSGVSQALKETTFTTGYQVAPGFLMMGEWRRDFSNQPFFLTSTLGLLKKEQNTATLGMTWWFGGKQGNW